MPSEYATAINIIAILSIIFGLIRRFYISWINKKEKQIERETRPSEKRIRKQASTRKTPREEAKSDVRTWISFISIILFIILLGSRVNTAEYFGFESGTSAEALGLLIYAFAVWLPVEVSVIAMVGGLLYVILQYEGFTTG
jgi:hypothetical protein